MIGPYFFDIFWSLLKDVSRLSLLFRTKLSYAALICNILVFSKLLFLASLRFVNILVSPIISKKALPYFFSLVKTTPFSTIRFWKDYLHETDFLVASIVDEGWSWKESKALLLTTRKAFACPTKMSLINHAERIKDFFQILTMRTQKNESHVNIVQRPIIKSWKAGKRFANF